MDKQFSQEQQPQREAIRPQGQSMLNPPVSIRSVRDLKLSGKTVLVRLDLNVPLENGRITDDSRIQEALPTVRYLIEQGCKLVLASHLGRPDGKRVPEFSLEPVALHMAELLGREITLAEEAFGDGVEMMIQSLKPGQVLMLENLRFYPGEETCDPDFSRKLARLAQVYVTDAFGTAHRKHASTWGVPSVMQTRGVGFLIEKELQFLDQLLASPGKPFYAVLGGAKVTDKIKTIESLMRRVDGFVIGGLMAHAFWEVQGETLPEGSKKPKPADVEAARAILREAKKRELPILLPADTNQGFDIGPKTIEKFSSFLSGARTIFWNGPLGWFERPEYAVGTHAVAQAIASLDECLKVVGGGDTVSAIKGAGLAAKFDHLSTGGGAVLEYLEGYGVPGIEVLKTYARQSPESPVLQ